MKSRRVGESRTPREVLIAWASSEGFAAVHNGTATDEQIVDDLLKWLREHGLAIVDLGSQQGLQPYG